MNLKTELKPHQIPAVEKVLPSRIGALFMDMGTGKSRTAIELVCHRLNKIDKIVWFCPVSLKETIRQEIRKHTEGTEVYVFNDKTSENNLPLSLWYIVGIESMSSSNRVVLAVNKLITEETFVILDESSYIKGHNAMRTERLIFICQRARYRLILTGTPLSQGVVDLYSQMKFLSPKILGYNSFYSFAANHLEYSEKYPGLIVRAHNTEYIAAKIQPYVYQITKEECLTLPSKLYTTRYFGRTVQQWNYYEQAKDEILSDLAEDEIDSIVIFRLFSTLQQIVSGFWNRRTGRGKNKKFELIEMDHCRIETLMDAVSEIPPGEKMIIWAKFQYDIMSIDQALREGFGPGAVALFYGDLNERRRAEQVERFRNCARFFVATQSCGGHGLTLNEAAYVVFYNNGFKYSERLQAEDRCHRIGQERKVTYIDIVCSDTIDERIQTALSKKGNVVKEFKAEVDKVKGKDKLRELVKSL